MDYDIIIIGATFCTAGMLQIYGDKCLVLERRPQAGYEFLNSLKFGEINNTPKSKEAKIFLEKLTNKGIFTEYGLNFFDSASIFYSYLADKNVLLNMEIININKIPGGFRVECCGASGIREFTASKIIDTTPAVEAISRKSINFLVSPQNDDIPPISDLDGMKVYPSGLKNDRICKIELDSGADYTEARRKIYDITVKNEFKGYRLDFVADCFEITTDGCPVTENNGITYLTSCAFDNGIEAFDAGVIYAREGKL